MPENARSIQQDALGFPSKLDTSGGGTPHAASIRAQYSANAVDDVCDRARLALIDYDMQVGDGEADREWAADHGQSGSGS
jgi:hypothetical protein